MSTPTLVPNHDGVAATPSGGIQLVGGLCRECGTEFFPTSLVCPECMGVEVVTSSMPTRGRLYSFTTVHTAAAKWPRPMRVGYVDLLNGVRVFTHLQGEALAIDQTVELAAAEVGVESDGTPTCLFVFRPEES
jgi:uncharacterized OB-fold protein